MEDDVELFVPAVRVDERLVRDEGLGREVRRERGEKSGLHVCREARDPHEGLVSQSESLKRQQEEVGRKVTRSQNLFKNLSAERGRWQESSEGFREQLANLVGDVLLSAGFLTYIGFFDAGYRVALRDQWTLSMDEISLKTSTRPALSYVEYLSKP